MNAPISSQVSETTLAVAQQYRDKKRYLWLLGPALPAIGLGILAGYRITPRPFKIVFALGGPIVLHLVIPALDALIGDDPSNPDQEAIRQLEQDPYYMRLVKSYLPLQYLTTTYGAYLASREETPWYERILLGVSIGAISGIAINTAHELSHKSTRQEHLLSHVALMATGYNHFRVEHPYGHHRRAATPEDPASSQMGESFYAFWPRTVIGSFKSAVEIETRRLKRKGKSFWSTENELLQGWTMSATYHASLIKAFGPRVLPYLATQAFYGISLFELINYIEHYGLLRQKRADGSYERTMPEHSWNNNHIVTNLFLYQLQRHSDHHAYPTRPFQALRHFDEAPELPSGYASMLLPALVPKWWFKLMDERVIQHYNGDDSKANIYAKKRDQVLAKFAKWREKNKVEAVN